MTVAEFGLFKDRLGNIVDGCVLFSVADGGLLQLGAFQREQNVIVSSLQDLDQDYHFFVFQQVVTPALPLTWVGVLKYQFANLVL